MASRYNSKWTRVVQDAVLTVLLDVWLGGSLVPDTRIGRLLTLEELGHLFQGSCRLFRQRQIAEHSMPSKLTVPANNQSLSI